jgi:hypothetical protein
MPMPCLTIRTGPEPPILYRNTILLDLALFRLRAMRHPPDAYDSTTSASFKDAKLVLRSQHYLTTITAALKDGELVGDTTLQGPGYSLHYGFHAVRHVETPAASAQNIPSIAGSWVILAQKVTSDAAQPTEVVAASQDLIDAWTKAP